MKTEKEIIEKYYDKVKELNNINIKDTEQTRKFDTIYGEIKALKWVLGENDESNERCK